MSKYITKSKEGFYNIKNLAGVFVLLGIVLALVYIAIFTIWLIFVNKFYSESSKTGITLFLFTSVFFIILFVLNIILFKQFFKKSKKNTPYFAILTAFITMVIFLILNVFKSLGNMTDNFNKNPEGSAIIGNYDGIVMFVFGVIAIIFSLIACYICKISRSREKKKKRAERNIISVNTAIKNEQNINFEENDAISQENS